MQPNSIRESRSSHHIPQQTSVIDFLVIRTCRKHHFHKGSKVQWGLEGTSLLSFLYLIKGPYYNLCISEAHHYISTVSKLQGKQYSPYQGKQVKGFPKDILFDFHVSQDQQQFKKLGLNVLRKNLLVYFHCQSHCLQLFAISLKGNHNRPLFRTRPQRLCKAIEALGVGRWGVIICWS